jgi:acetyl-CoA acetyltransferase family protein
MAVLLNDLPTSIPGATVNRLCASSLEAAIQASRAIETGDAEIVLTGGVESMSRAPWVVLKPDRGFERASQTMHSTILGWRMVNPRMHERWTIGLGESAELLATRYEISRERQDEFALASHHNAAKAWDSGFYESWVVPTPDAELDRDENIKPSITPEQLAERRPAFAENGTVTAGNSSPLNDGAAAVLIASEAAAHEIGATPLARIAGRGVSGIDPDIFGVAPIEAANRALARAGIEWKDVSVVELNEAFASQSLACVDGWPDLDPDAVNPNGGAIAVGHPLGASGARVLGGLAHELVRRGGGWGVATLCIGVGQGLAVVLEGVAP